ncbi:MAG: M48 family metalloprotease [Pyrinomonadaceae bacterium]
MRKLSLNKYGKSLTAATLLWAIFALPLAAFGQTRIVAPKNKYSVQEDVKLGQQAARQVEQQMPILNDYQSQQYLQSVGERLVAAIPPEYQHPEFRYSFKIVNARDINAFALPGGPMSVNRGMIEAAQNEGEMAGVMAHELSHVALRHGTAQATEQNRPLNQVAGIGSILLGAILGGQTGAAIGQTLYRGFLVNPYSRAYETQADTLGAQIMACAGYDPRDLANMFKTIERQSGGGTPEFLSDHPNPENRFENINREASMLRVSPEPIKLTQGFIRTKRYLESLPPAPTSAQIEQAAQNGQVYGNGGGSTTSNGRYETRVEYPSSRTRNYNLGAVSINAPENWQVVNQSNTEVWFAPQGAVGNQGITRGALVGVMQNGGGNLRQATDNYVRGILQVNNYLRARSNYQRANVGGRGGLAITLAGTSPINGRTEIDTIYTTQLSDGSLFYVVTVVPQSEASNYNYAFRNMIRSIQFSDR